MVPFFLLQHRSLPPRCLRLSEPHCVNMQFPRPSGDCEVSSQDEAYMYYTSQLLTTQSKSGAYNSRSDGV